MSGIYTASSVNWSDRVTLSAISNDNLDFEGNSGADVNITGIATLGLNGSTSGTLSQQAAATTTSYTITWPSAVGAANQFLQTDASGNLSWVANSGVPGGSDTQIQYNNSGSFGGTSGITTNGTDMHFADNINLGFGNTIGAPDFTITHVAGGNTIFDNTNGLSNTVFRLGTDTQATSFQVHNNSEVAQFAVLGDGVVNLPDSGTFSLGTALTDFTMTHNGTNTVITSATGDLVVDNTNATGSTILQLGTDTNATDVQIQNNTGTAAMTVYGDSEATFAADVTFQGEIVKDVTISTVNTAANVTYTAAQMQGGLILRDPAGSARTDEVDTAANLVAGVHDAGIGSSYTFTVENTADAAETITLGGTPSGITYDTNGNFSIAQNQSRTFLVRFTNVTASSEAATIYSISIGGSVSGGGGSPSAPLTSVQYNNGGAFGGSANFTFDGNTVHVDNTIENETEGNSLTVQTVDRTAAGAGGALNLVSGAGNTGGAGGVIGITAGTGGVTGAGGAVTIDSGAGGSTSGNGGDVTITASQATSGTDGQISLVQNGETYLWPTDTPVVGEALSVQSFATNIATLEWATPSAAAGGSDTQVQYNNSTALGGISSITTNGTTTMTWADNASAIFGTGSDFTITHNGTITTLTNTTGNLIFDNEAAVASTIFRLGTDTVLTNWQVTNNSETALFTIQGNGTTNIPDNMTLAFGDATGADFTITHNGTNTVMTSATGDLFIDNTNTSGSTIMLLGTDTTATDFQVQNNSASPILSVDGGGTVNIPDNGILSIGTGDDLQITHNTTNTVMTSATGDLTIDNTNTTGSTIMQLGTDTDATDFQVQNNTGTAIIAATSSGGFNYDQVIYVDEKTATTAGGGFTQELWETRDLNTTRFSRQTTSWASLSSNQITLQAGDYYVEASAPAYNVNRHQTRFQNTTDATTDIIGTSAYTAAGNNATTISFIIGQVSIASAKTFELQHQCQTTQGTNGRGVESDLVTSPINNTYSVIRIVKLA